uniref:PCI domain-containing protein n=1 Tax=Chlamydomonas leiostraca TaxID=1034604 RepID=A0A7S0WIJ5_9CHLO|mmetsp:Transcript_148/g.327  ORF Transcript_148/g.327 Transcript_148/m.327 type:complete len:412 (+) Transcript_148:133-1368(+)
MSLASYISSVVSAVNSRNGKRLKELFRLDSDAALVAMQVAQRGGNVPAGEINRQLPAPWNDIVLSYLQALVHVTKGERLQACKEFRERHCRGLLDCLSEDVWMLPAVVGMATTLKNLAAQADVEALRKGANVNTTQLSACCQLLQMAFSRTGAAKGQHAEAKRAAAVGIGNVMLAIYFRLNTLTNCKQITTQIDRNAADMLDAAVASERVTYRYYTGRLKAYDEDFSGADEDLSYAFAQCHPAAYGNRRRILTYLVPIKMLLGVLPSDDLLQKYKLTEYMDVAKAVRTGDVGLLMRTLDANQAVLVQAGTYLLLEKMQLAAYRRLFKKCALVHAEAQPGKATQVPLALMQRALELQGLPKDDAELQCLVANLIYRKYIRGYVAYKARVVVLAKTDAFPPLSAVALADPFSA